MESSLFGGQYNTHKHEVGGEGKPEPEVFLGCGGVRAVHDEFLIKRAIPPPGRGSGLSYRRRE